jgi:hypothetical protein
MEGSQEFWFDRGKPEVYREAIALMRTATRDYDQSKRTN